MKRVVIAIKADDGDFYCFDGTNWYKVVKVEEINIDLLPKEVIRVYEECT